MTGTGLVEIRRTPDIRGISISTEYSSNGGKKKILNLLKSHEGILSQVCLTSLIRNAFKMKQERLRSNKLGRYADLQRDRTTLLIKFSFNHFIIHLFICLSSIN